MGVGVRVKREGVWVGGAGATRGVSERGHAWGVLLHVRRHVM